MKPLPPEEDAELVAADNLNMAAGADSLAVEAGCNSAVEGHSVSLSCELLSRTAGKALA